MSNTTNGVIDTNDVVDDECARVRVPKSKFLGNSYFAAGYAGEHVAGGEFIVGAAFAAWGASPMSIILGLLIGNLLAVASWALICSPIATKARLTLYYYTEQVAGKKFTFFYSLLHGVVFAVIAGGMMTISASAVRGLTNAPQQVNWYPTSMLFVFLVLLTGAATIFLTIRGFKKLLQFAKLCVPWLMAIFLICGIAALPFLIHIGNQEGIPTSELLSHYVWTGRTPDGSEPFSVWQIAAFAWGLNLPLHLGMGDLSTLRFAKKTSYGLNSIFAAFGGHFVAWVTAGILGATTAAMLQVHISSLDIGGVVVPILGISGTAAVMIASLTTAVPSLYRASLAFQSLFANVSLNKVTIVLGVIMSIVACSPIIFLKWLDLLAYFNIALVPVGAIIFAEHFVLPRLGIAPFWHHRVTVPTNYCAWLSWLVGVIVAAILLINETMHLFFIFIPVWVVCFVVYVAAAKYRSSLLKGDTQDLTIEQMYIKSYGQDDDAIISEGVSPVSTKKMYYANPLFILSIVCLVVMVVASFLLFLPDNPTLYLKSYQWVIALCGVGYFAFMLLWSGSMTKQGVDMS